MKSLANLLIALVALEHVAFLVLEMFLWDTPTGMRVFGLSEAFARESASLAANQGLYNGFLAAGLVWALLRGDEGFDLKVFFLVCVVVAGVFGAATASGSILFVQAVPAALALGAVLVTREQQPRIRPEDPAKAAETFAAARSADGFALDFSLVSLETEVDRLLDSEHLPQGREDAFDATRQRNAAGLGAYVGETLRRAHQGVWCGDFFGDNNAANFYCSYVDLRGHHYWPSRWLEYRITNGPVEGGFGPHLAETQREVEREGSSALP